MLPDDVFRSQLSATIESARAGSGSRSSSTAKIAAGLLADSATKIILRQAPDQVDATASHFGLTEPEARIVGQLARGRALWKIGGRSAVVHHLMALTEESMCDTDARMSNPRVEPALESIEAA